MKRQQTTINRAQVEALASLFTRPIDELLGILQGIDAEIAELVEHRAAVEAAVQIRQKMAPGEMQAMQAEKNLGQSAGTVSSQPASELPYTGQGLSIVGSPSQSGPIGEAPKRRGRPSKEEVAAREAAAKAALAAVGQQQQQLQAEQQSQQLQAEQQSQQLQAEQPTPAQPTPTLVNPSVQAGFVEAFQAPAAFQMPGPMVAPEPAPVAPAASVAPPASVLQQPQGMGYVPAAITPGMFNVGTPFQFPGTGPVKS
jgi:hypothetical protein